MRPTPSRPRVTRWTPTTWPPSPPTSPGPSAASATGCSTSPRRMPAASLAWTWSPAPCSLPGRPERNPASALGGPGRLFGAQSVLGAGLGGPAGREHGADEGDDQSAEGECDEFGQGVDRDVGRRDAGADGAAHERHDVVVRDDTERHADDARDQPDAGHGGQDHGDRLARGHSERLEDAEVVD